MNQNQVAYLLYRSCSNHFSSVEHFEPRISIAHVQFFRLQVPFSPKFEADFWPDERLEQVSNLITVFYFQDLFSWFSFSGKPSERKPLIFGSSFKSPFNLQVLPSIQRFSFNQIFQWIQFFNFAGFFLRFFFKFAGNSWQQLHLWNMEWKLGQRFQLRLQVSTMNGIVSLKKLSSWKFRDRDDSLVMVDVNGGGGRVMVPGNIMRDPRVFRWHF